MSSYYSGIPLANLPNGGTQDPFHVHESKYESSYYGSGAAGMSGYGEGDPQHPGFPRFPPYDRIDIRPITGKPGYNHSHANLPSSTPVSGGGVYHQSSSLGPQYGQQAQNGNSGQYSGDDLTSCKVTDSGLVSPHGTPQAASPGQPGLVPHPYSANNALGNVVNGVQPQNIPIYPWMRPMNGGKRFFYSA